RDPERRPPARLVYNRERKWSGTGAVFQTANRVRRQRTSEDSLPVKSILDRECNRIRVTKIRRVPGRKVRHKRHVRLRPAHALREAIAVEGSETSNWLPHLPGFWRAP